MAVSTTSLGKAQVGVALGSGRARTAPRPHPAVVGPLWTTRRRTSVLAAACRAEGHGRRPRESRAAGRAAATAPVSRGVATRQVAVVTGVGQSCRRTVAGIVAGAEAGVASRRRVVVSRVPRVAGRAATTVVRATVSPVAIRAGKAVATRRAASHVVARRRATADRGRAATGNARWPRVLLNHSGWCGRVPSGRRPVACCPAAPCEARVGGRTRPSRWLW